MTEEVGDRSTDEALEKAEQLMIRGVTFNRADVDRFGGLFLYGPDGTWHFRTPLCGYGGTGPHATADILAIFGFGDHKEILQRISHGGDAAHFTFNR